MLFVDRNITPPEIFKHPSIVKFREELKTFYENSPALRRQMKPPTSKIPSSVIKKIIEALNETFHGRCAYCEGPVNLNAYGAFDHFRPKREARGLKGEYAPDHYWPLAFEWRNMYLSCAECNKYKINWFPVKGKRSNKKEYDQIVKEEHNLIVDPCRDHPEYLLGYVDNTCQIATDNEQGARTIEILKLNRKTLVNDVRIAVQRGEEILDNFTHHWVGTKVNKTEFLKALRSLETYLSQLWENSGTLYYPSAQYMMVDNYFLEKRKELFYFFVEDKTPSSIHPSVIKFIKENGKDLTRQVTSKFGSENVRYWAKHIDLLRDYGPSETRQMYLERIVIRNFKAIKNITVDFPKSDKKNESWLMLLGENAVGKSCFLQALTMTLVGREYLDKLSAKPKNILRHGEKSGSVEVYVTGKVELKKNGNRSSAHRASMWVDPIRLEFNNDLAYAASNLKKPGTYILAYGSTRLPAAKGLKQENNRGLVRSMNLFDPAYALRNAVKWLLDIKNKNKFDRVAVALKDLLLLQNDDIILREKGNVYIKYAPLKNSQKRTVPKKDKLQELSDGYKSIIAVAVDIMSTLLKENTSMETAEGIVLLDEIGTHLHPRWRMEVVKSFRRTFPRLQFIVTTHDPLCLRGLGKGEVIVFKKDEDGDVFTMKDLPNPGELRADQLLNSEFFGLRSTIDPDLEKLFNEYYELLRKEEHLKPAKLKRLKDLKASLFDKRHLGNSLREELAFGAVDKLLARQEVSKAAPQREVLTESAVRMVEEMWTKLLTGKNDQTK